MCVSSLRRGHANLLCIVPILSYETGLTPLGFSRLPNDFRLWGRYKASWRSTAQQFESTCSGGVVGYHASLTHWRSRVRSSPRILLFLVPKQKKQKEKKNPRSRRRTSDLEISIKQLQSPALPTELYADGHQVHCLAGVEPAT